MRDPGGPYDLTKLADIQRLAARFADVSLRVEELVDAFGATKETDEEAGLELRYIHLEPRAKAYAQVSISTMKNGVSKHWPYAIDVTFADVVPFVSRDLVDAYGELGVCYDTGRLPMWSFPIDSPRISINILLSGVGFTPEILRVQEVGIHRALKEDEMARPLRQSR